MIKQVYIAECDVCGAVEKAQLGDYWNDENVILPKGWEKSSTNNDFCICPKCLKKFSGGNEDGQ